MTLIELLRNNQTIKEEFFSETISQVIDQIDVLDPAEDSDELLDLIEGCLESKEGSALFCYLLGVKDIEEWLKDTLDLLDE